MTGDMSVATHQVDGCHLGMERREPDIHEGDEYDDDEVETSQCDGWSESSGDEIVVRSEHAPLQCVAGGCVLCGREFYEVMRRGSRSYPTVSLTESKDDTEIVLGYDTLLLLVMKFTSSIKRKECEKILWASIRVMARAWYSRVCHEGGPQSTLIREDGLMEEVIPEEEGAEAMLLCLYPIPGLMDGSYKKRELVAHIRRWMGFYDKYSFEETVRLTEGNCEIQFVPRKESDAWIDERWYFLEYCKERVHAP